MNITFFKYHLNGNDFLIFDKIFFPDFELTEEKIKKICNRNFGVGADGILILEISENGIFKFNIYNPDGSYANFCGNGALCFLKYLKDKRYFVSSIRFLAGDGIHYGNYIGNDKFSVSFSDIDLKKIKKFNNLGYIVDVGTLHLVLPVINVLSIDCNEKGKEYNHLYGKPINVTFFESTTEDSIKKVTYEKGVEKVTMSCGTGAVASTIIFLYQKPQNDYEILVNTLGGPLVVKVTKNNSLFKNIHLIGEPKFIFEGKLDFNYL